MHSPCRSAVTRAGKSLNLLGGNASSLPLLTGYQCRDPPGDLIPPNSEKGSPRLSDNCQFMLMGHQGHQGIFTERCSDDQGWRQKVLSAYQALPPCIHSSSRTQWHSWDQGRQLRGEQPTSKKMLHTGWLPQPLLPAVPSSNGEDLASTAGGRRTPDSQIKALPPCTCHKHITQTSYRTKVEPVVLGTGAQKHLNQRTSHLQLHIVLGFST